MTGWRRSLLRLAALTYAVSAFALTTAGAVSLYAHSRVHRVHLEVRAEREIVRVLVNCKRKAVFTDGRPGRPEVDLGLLRPDDLVTLEVFSKPQAGHFSFRRRIDRDRWETVYRSARGPLDSRFQRQRIVYRTSFTGSGRSLGATGGCANAENPWPASAGRRAGPTPLALTAERLDDVDSVARLLPVLFITVVILVAGVLAAMAVPVKSVIPGWVRGSLLFATASALGGYGVLSKLSVTAGYIALAATGALTGSCLFSWWVYSEIRGYLVDRGHPTAASEMAAASPEVDAAERESH